MSRIARGLLGGGLGLTLLLGTLVPPSEAVIKALVVVGKLYFGDADGTRNPAGTRVCATIYIDPYALDVRTVLECGVRVNLLGTTMCTQLATLIVNRALAEYGVTVVRDDLAIQGCPAP